MRGLRADQILASEAFGLVTTRSIKSTDALVRYTELSGKTRTSQEEEEFHQLYAQLQESLNFGETPFEQLVEKAVHETLDKLLGQATGFQENSGIVNFEVKRQLRELFPSEPV